MHGESLGMHLTHLSLQHLSTLVAVIQHGSMSAAAAVLCYSLSTVSGHVSHLERQLRTELIDRSQGRALPTEEGRRVAAIALKMLRMSQEIVHATRPGETTSRQKTRDHASADGT